jgi:hypothetical protein
MPTNVPFNRKQLYATPRPKVYKCRCAVHPPHRSEHRSNTETAVVTPLRQLHCVRLGGDLGPCDIRLHDYNVESPSTHKSLFNTAPNHHTHRSWLKPNHQTAKPLNMAKTDP